MPPNRKRAIACIFVILCEISDGYVQRFAGTLKSITVLTIDVTAVILVFNKT